MPSTHFVGRQADPLSHRPWMAATAFSLKGAFSGSGTVRSPRRRLIMLDTLSKHDQKLGVEFMRRYCDLAAILLGTPQTVLEYTGDAARPALPLPSSWADVSTISSSTFRRWYASRPPTVLAKHLGRFSCRQVHAPGSVRQIFIRPGRAVRPPFRLRRALLALGQSQTSIDSHVKGTLVNMRALRICRRRRKHLADACVGDAMAANRLRGWLIRWRTHANEGGERSPCGLVKRVRIRRQRPSMMDRNARQPRHWQWAQGIRRRADARATAAHTQIMVGPAVTDMVECTESYEPTEPLQQGFALRPPRKRPSSSRRVQSSC